MVNSVTVLAPEVLPIQSIVYIIYMYKSSEVYIYSQICYCHLYPSILQLMYTVFQLIAVECDCFVR